MKRHILALSLTTALAFAAPFAVANQDEVKDGKTHACPMSAEKCPMMKDDKDAKACKSHNHRPGKGHWEDKKEEMDQFLTEIGVTDAQKTQLDAIKADTKSQMELLGKSKLQQHHELMVYMASPNATEAEALRREHAIEDLHEQMSHLKIQSAFRMKAVLTAEQQAKFAAHLQEKMQKMETMHKEHHGAHGDHHEHDGHDGHEDHDGHHHDDEHDK